MKCPDCQSEVEMASADMYMKCTKCKHIFMNVGGNWQLYPIEDSMRQYIEPSLGFAPDAQFAAPKKEVPKNCSMCQGNLEVLDKEGNVTTRCEKCGLLSSWDGNYLMPIIVQSPSNGGWDAEFQAIFEEKLGFSKKLRNKPPGVV